MGNSRQKYEVTFSFVYSPAFATVSVEAFDEAHAIRVAQENLNKELCPTLHHIQLIA
ncbi:hypothetical protein PQR39_35425 [Paraburkholderia sediminicola]|uniref:hypothetical protein n=1 Tax=Paraburkholderia sediminicola TaxID=458836 RepID=UPI0038BD8BA2